MIHTEQRPHVRCRDAYQTLPTFISYIHKKRCAAPRPCLSDQLATPATPFLFLVHPYPSAQRTN